MVKWICGLGSPFDMSTAGSPKLPGTQPPLRPAVQNTSLTKPFSDSGEPDARPVNVLDAGGVEGNQSVKVMLNTSACATRGAAKIKAVTATAQNAFRLGVCSGIVNPFFRGQLKKLCLFWVVGWHRTHFARAFHA